MTKNSVANTVLIALVLAVNPFKFIPSLFSDAALQAYVNRKPTDKRTPHTTGSDSCRGYAARIGAPLDVYYLYANEKCAKRKIEETFKN